MDYRCFEWDDAKANSNRLKHGISFEEAAQVFADEFRIMQQDRIENGEARWQTLGQTNGAVVLLVAHTVWDDEEGIEVVRIISARLATRAERRHYHDHRAKNLG
ncbi:MAG: BrnT family toxin [Lautropia sp.]|nr:BrnT family toxin [Lautropia sp.]